LSPQPLHRDAGAGASNHARRDRLAVAEPVSPKSGRGENRSLIWDGKVSRFDTIPDLAHARRCSRADSRTIGAVRGGRLKVVPSTHLVKPFAAPARAAKRRYWRWRSRKPTAWVHAAGVLHDLRRA
jgi:hypothetical protein